MTIINQQEDWEVKANETWIRSFLSCSHQLADKCNCMERKRELKMHIDRLLSTQEEQIRKEERKRLENEFGDFAHEQYMGNEEWNGTRVYAYKNEVCNMVEEYFNQTK